MDLFQYFNCIATVRWQIAFQFFFPWEKFHCSDRATAKPAGN